VIPLEEIPSLFRAVGFYPSEDEVQNVINEVRYKHFVNTGETQEFVGLVSIFTVCVYLPTLILRTSCCCRPN
jgi:Ca2+-binding EF-hand superfamily protein